MGFVLRIIKRAGAALIVLAAGCVSRPEAEPVALGPERHVRVVSIQTIPRFAWIEVNGGYAGQAPIDVPIDVMASGRPRQLVILRATDVASGAFDEKRFYSHPVPERVLFDLRSLIFESGL